MGKLIVVVVLRFTYQINANVLTRWHCDFWDFNLSLFFYSYFGFHFFFSYCLLQLVDLWDEIWLKDDETRVHTLSLKHVCRFYVYLGFFLLSCISLTEAFQLSTHKQSGINNYIRFSTRSIRREWILSLSCLCFFIIMPKSLCM